MKEFFKWFVPVSAAVILVWVGWCWWFGFKRPSAPADVFTGIESLFSGLAFAGVVTVVVLQTKELQLQRNELALNREQATKTAKANEKAAESLAGQIQMQTRAAKLAAVSSLLDSVNSQLGPGTGPGDDVQTLIGARGKYHGRLHQILQEMDRPV